jgi:hypothetical protein
MLVVPLALALALALSCGAPPPAASYSPTATEIELPYGFATPFHGEWHCLTELPAGTLTLFVHLLDAAGQLVRTFDQEFSDARVAGCKVLKPIELWQSVLDEPIPPGRYGLHIGLVTPDGQRLPLSVIADDQAIAGERRSYRVATVVVPEPSPELPALRFEGGWKPASNVAALQLAGQRWLEGDGALVAPAVGRAIRLRLWLRWLDAEGLGLRTVLDEGAEQATFEVRAGCRGGEGRFVGAGRHDVRIDFQFDGAPADCRVEIDPNFVLVDPETLGRSSLGLERAVWRELPPEPGLAVVRPAPADGSAQDGAPLGENP